LASLAGYRWHRLAGEPGHVTRDREGFVITLAKVGIDLSMKDLLVCEDASNLKVAAKSSPGLKISMEAAI
jgi:hypothetical protein